MSVFTNTDNQVTNPNGETATTQENQSFVEALVKIKGEKFKDPEVLAKSKLEADNYIEELKAKLKAQEDFDREKEYLEGLKKTILDKATGVSQSKEKETPEVLNGQTALKPEDVESLIEQTLTKKAVKDRAKQNLEAVEKALEEELGTEAAKVVEEKAASLGMTKDRLAEIAAESPDAFFRLVDIPNKKGGKVVTSTVNTQSMKGQVRDFKYYEALRKSNPKIANDPSYYSAMERDRFALGDRFFK